LRLSDEIRALLNPERAFELDEDAEEPSSASDRAVAKPPTGCDDADWGDVSDWMASRAAEAAPIAGSMAELQMAARVRCDLSN
jgi:hypothetical protein